MKLAIISDIHGNAIALRRCLVELEEVRVDALYFLGDAVGYFPGERDVLDLLTKAGAVCLKGNHEAMLADPTLVPDARERVYRLSPVRARLGSALRSRLSAWPITREMEVDGRRLLFVHGAPADPLFGYIYEDAVESDLRDVTSDVVFMGHTHRPFVRRCGGRLFVNAGSVGLPRDGRREGTFAIYDSGSDSCEIRKFALNVDEILARYGRDIDGQVRRCLLRYADEVERE